jgi:hypothetical protein
LVLKLIKLASANFACELPLLSFYLVFSPNCLPASSSLCIKFFLFFKLENITGSKLQGKRELKLELKNTSHEKTKSQAGTKLFINSNFCTVFLVLVLNELLFNNYI